MPSAFLPKSFQRRKLVRCILEPLRNSILLIIYTKNTNETRIYMWGLDLLLGDIHEPPRNNKTMFYGLLPIESSNNFLKINSRVFEHNGRVFGMFNYSIKRCTVEHFIENIYNRIYVLYLVF